MMVLISSSHDIPTITKHFAFRPSTLIWFFLSSSPPLLLSSSSLHSFSSRSLTHTLCLPYRVCDSCVPVTLFTHPFHVPYLPLPLSPHLLSINTPHLNKHSLLKETSYHASIYNRPNGLFTRSFAPRSQPRPGGLHSSFTRCQYSCPHKSIHRWPCSPHVRTSGSYHRPR